MPEREQRHPGELENAEILLAPTVGGINQVSISKHALHRRDFN